MERTHENDRKAAREEGHAAEERADSLTGEARAAELDKAADAFDLAAFSPSRGIALGHYAARARACREEATAIRNAQAEADTHEREARAYPMASESMALDRLRRSGITLMEAMDMTDKQLLSLPLIGRKCLRYIRNAQAEAEADAHEREA